MKLFPSNENDLSVTVYEIVKFAILETICKVRGHKIKSDGADVENGSEDLSCDRCGMSETYYMSGGK